MPLVSTASRQIKNKSWEKTSLKTIATDIAGNCDLELRFSGEDFKYDRIQQTNQTDLEFLNKLTVEQQKCMKITSDKETGKNILWIQEEEELEKQKPVLTVTPQSEMVNRSLNIDFTQIYKSAKVVSTNSKKKGIIKSTATDKNIDGVSRELVVKLAKNALKTVTLPNTITEIGNGAFEACESLTDIVIPDSVTIFGYNVFDFCTKLTNVKLSKNLVEIDKFCFAHCYKKLGKDIFARIYLLKNIVLIGL